MSIQIIDGFKLSVSKPVDDRMVTSGTSSRNSIAYKYDGLRVFDTAQKTAFVWIDGQWKKESETSVVSGAIPGLVGTLNKVVKFTDTNKIGDSSIYDNGTRVGIGTTNPDLAVRLDVDGNIKADSFQGSGTYLTAINASNITNGTIGIGRLPNGSTNQILASGTSNPQWIDISTLSTGTVTVTNDTGNSTNQYINFTNATSGSVTIKVSSTGLLFNPSKNQLLIKSDSSSNPAYSFVDNADTGIYRLSGEKSIGFSTSGTSKMVIKSDGKVGIGTTSPYTSLHIVGQTDNVNTSTSNTAGQIFLSDPDSISQGLVLGYAYYAGQYEYARIQTQGIYSLVLQEKGGRVKIGQVSNYYDTDNLLDVNGHTRIRGILNIGDKTGSDAQIEIGGGRTTNGNAYIDLTGTANQADYDFRIIRGNQGTNAVTYLSHKGTGNFEITAENAASIYFKTSNVERIRITDQGIKAQNGSAVAPSYFFDGETTTGLYRSAANSVGVSISGIEKVKFYNEGIDIKANGAVLKLKSITQGQNTYIEFFGKGTLSLPNSLTDRSAYVGFSSINPNKDFVIYNALTEKYISIADQISIIGNTVITGTAQVTGNTVITGTAQVTGTLTVDSNINMNNTLKFTDTSYTIKSADGDTALSGNNVGLQLYTILNCSGLVITSNATSYASYNTTSGAITWSTWTTTNPALTYDIQIIATSVTGTDSEVLIEIDRPIGGSIVVSRAVVYNTATAIIPAGYTWRLIGVTLAGGAQVNTTIYKVGKQAL